MTRRDKTLRVIRMLRDAIAYSEANTNKPYLYARERVNRLMKEV